MIDSKEKRDHMLKWKIERRKLSELIPHDKNPRILTREQCEQLKKSISKFGLIDKPVITKDGRLIGGHQRVHVMMSSGFTECDCWICEDDLSDKDIEELMLRLNRNTGDWDWDLLANHFDLEDLIELGFDESDIVYDDEEIKDDGEDDSKELEPGNDEDAETKLGDVYELNEHRLVCGDSTLPEYVEKCLNGAQPILMVTDPPYGVNYNPNWRNGFGFSNKRTVGKVQNDDKVNWTLAWHLFPGSVAYVWSSDKFAFESVKSLIDSEYQIINQIIWVKQHFAISRGDYHSQHEPCWYAVKKGHKHSWQGARDQSTVWEIASLNAFGKSTQEDERTAHSTQKPLECMARPIRNNTTKGEGVYDPFLGSGTTLIAAEMNDRICYGIELSQAYCDIIVNRWVNFMKKNNREYTVKKNGVLLHGRGS